MKIPSSLSINSTYVRKRDTLEIIRAERSKGPLFQHRWKLLVFVCRPATATQLRFMGYFERVRQIHSNFSVGTLLPVHNIRRFRGWKQSTEIFLYNKFPKIPNFFPLLEIETLIFRLRSSPPAPLHGRFKMFLPASFRTLFATEWYIFQ